MRLIYLCNEYPPAPHGGIGSFVKTLSHAMSAAGHSVTIVGLGADGSERWDGGVRVVTIAASRLRYLGPIWDRFRVRRWIREESRTRGQLLVEVPDYGGLLPLAMSSPVVVRLHGSATSIQRVGGAATSRGIRIFEKRTLRRHRAWIGASQHVKLITEETFGVEASRSVVIYHPVEALPPEAIAIPAPPTFVLFVGTVSEHKGAHLLALAMRDLMATKPDLHLVYVGQEGEISGVRASTWIRNAIGDALLSKVHFSGRQTREIARMYMRRAVAVVLPSRLEAFGLVVIESMLEGAPVVVPDSGPFTEYVRNEETGLTFDFGKPESLGRQIGRIIDDPALASRLTVAAKEFVGRRCTASECQRQTEAFYAVVLNEYDRRQAS